MVVCSLWWTVGDLLVACGLLMGRGCLVVTCGKLWLAIGAVGVTGWFWLVVVEKRCLRSLTSCCIHGAQVADSAFLSCSEPSWVEGFPCWAENFLKDSWKLATKRANSLDSSTHCLDVGISTTSSMILVLLKTIIFISIGHVNLLNRSWWITKSRFFVEASRHQCCLKQSPSPQER